MHFDHDAVRSGGNGRLGQRFNHPPLARRVARVYDDRQVALMLDGQHGAEVQRVAGVRFKGADAPFAEDDVAVAAGHDVFRRHKPFFDGRAEAALEEDGLARLADGLEQLEILHVAGADLDDVDVVFQEQVDFIGRHDFRYDGQVRFLPGLAEHVQPLVLEALKRVRRRAGLEGATAQHRRAGGLDGLGYAFDLLRRFYGAGAGDDSQLLPANLYTADVDDRIGRMEGTAGPLVRLFYADDLVYVFISCNLLSIDNRRIAD